MIKGDDDLGSGYELEQINYKFPYSTPYYHYFTPYPHPPRLVRFEREGMRKNYHGNIANEINMLGCITFVTRYGVVVGVASKHFVLLGWIPECCVREY